MVRQTHLPRVEVGHASSQLPDESHALLVCQRLTARPDQVAQRADLCKLREGGGNRG